MRPGLQVDVVMWRAVAREFLTIHCMEALKELARRLKGQAPPPWVIWEALCDPWRPNGREWFDLRTGELGPRLLDSRKPDLVVWSSIWEDRPELKIRFEIAAGGAGSAVTWTLLGPELLSGDEIKRRRYRIDQLINGQLRQTFDQ
jgi:hypothetical protein